MHIKMSKKRWIQPIYITLLFILCLIGPEFKVFPRYTWVLSGIGLFTFYDRKFVKQFGLLSKVNIYYFLYLGICVFCALIPPIINHTYDFSYITLLIGIILTSLRGILLIYVLYKDNIRNVFERFMECFLNACCVCVVFTLLFIVFPEFKNFWCNDVLVDVYKSDYSYYEFRYTINGFAGFSMASILAVASVLGGYTIAKDEKINQWHIIKFIFVIVGCFFYGRIAIVGVVLGALIIVGNKKDKGKTIKLVLKIVLFVLLLLVLLNYLATIDDKFYYWREWAFSFIKDLFVEGKITDYSVTHLFEDMYWMPNLKTLILGDGYYTDPVTQRYYMSTDSGIMRVVLYAGVGGVFLFWGALVFIFLRSYRWVSLRIEKKLFIYLILLWLVLEVKGESFQRMLMLIYPIFLCLYNRRKRLGNNE